MTSEIIYTDKSYVVYNITYSGNKLPSKNNSNISPSNYIGSTSIEHIKKGYMGSVRSKKYKDIWKSELKNNLHLFKLEIISYHDTRSDAMYKELYIQMIFNALKNPLFVNMSYAAPNGYFGMDISGKNHPLYNTQRTDKEKLLISENHADVSGINNPMSGKTRITNGFLNSTIDNEDQIPNGWYKGLTFNTPRKKETKSRKKYKKETKSRATKGIKRKKFICIIENKKEYDISKAKIIYPNLQY